jgi:hypothetical protein
VQGPTASEPALVVCLFVEDPQLPGAVSPLLDFLGNSSSCWSCSRIGNILAVVFTVGREDGYTHFSREESIPTTGSEGEIYRLSFRVGELERRRDQGDLTEEEKNELDRLSLRRQLLLGQVLLGEM